MSTATSVKPAEDYAIRYDYVRDEFERWKLANPDADITLPDYAKAKDYLEKTPERRMAAYTTGPLRTINYYRNSLLSPFSSYTKDALGAVGDYGDKLLGGGNELGYLGREMGRDLPMSAIEMSLYPQGAFTKLIASGGKVVKPALQASAIMGSQALEATSQTGSPGAGLAAAATLPLNIGLMEKGGRLGRKTLGGFDDLINVIDKQKADKLFLHELDFNKLLTASPKVSNIRAATGHFLGETAGNVLGNEITRQAMITGMNPTAGWDERNPFSEENRLQVLAMNVGALLPSIAKQSLDLRNIKNAANLERGRIINEYISDRIAAAHPSKVFAGKTSVDTAKLVDLLNIQYKEAHGQGFLKESHALIAQDLILKSDEMVKVKTVLENPEADPAIRAILTTHMQHLRERVGDLERLFFGEAPLGSVEPTKGLTPGQGMITEKGTLTPGLELVDVTTKLKTNIKEQSNLKGDEFAQSFQDTSTPDINPIDEGKKVQIIASLFDIKDEADLGRFTGMVEQSISKLRNYYKKNHNIEYVDLPVIKSMLKGGEIPEIDLKWLASEFDTLLQGVALGDKKTAQDLVINLVANRVLNAAEEAYPQHVRKLPGWAGQEEMVFKLFSTFPEKSQIEGQPSKRDRFMEMYLRLANGRHPFKRSTSGEYLPEAEKNLHGALQSRLPAWRQRLLQVQQTMGPDGIGEYKVYEGKTVKKVVRASIDDLLTEEHIPPMRPVTVEEGGTPTRERGRTTSFSELEQEAYQRGSRVWEPEDEEASKGQKLYTGEDERDVAPVDHVVDGVSTAQAADYQNRLTQVGTALREKLQSLQNLDVTNLVKELFGHRTKGGDITLGAGTSKLKFARNAILATFGDPEAKKALYQQLSEDPNQALHKHGEEATVSRYLRRFWGEQVPSLDLSRNRVHILDDSSKIHKFVTKMIGAEAAESLTGRPSGLKRPFEMMPDEYEVWKLDQSPDYKRTHRDWVEAAVVAGKKVPDVVKELYGLSKPRSEMSDVTNVLKGKAPVSENEKLGMTKIEGLVTSVESARLVRNFLMTKYGLSSESAGVFAQAAARVSLHLSGGLDLGFGLYTKEGSFGGFIPHYKTRKDQAGLNVDTISDLPKVPPEQRPVIAAIKLIKVLVHELTHVQEHHRQVLTETDPIAKQRRESSKKMQAIFAQMTPQERDYMLTTVRDALIPPDLRSYFDAPERGAGTRGYELEPQSIDGGEFMTVMSSYVLYSAFTQTASNPFKGRQYSPAELLQYLPDEMVAYWRGYARDAFLLSESIAELIENPTIGGGLRSKAVKVDSTPKPNVALRFREANKALQDIFEARDYAKAHALAGAIVGALEHGTISEAGKFLDIRGTKAHADLDLRPGPIDPKIARRVGEAMGNLAPENGKRAGLWTRFTSPFYWALRRMEQMGIPYMREVGYILQRLQPAYAELQSRLLRPFLMRNDHGKWIYDDNHPLFQLLADPEKAQPARQMITQLALWQNEHKAPAFEKAPDGTFHLTEEVQMLFGKTFDKLSPADQQASMAGLASLLESYGNAAGLILSSQVEVSNFRIARLLQKLIPNMKFEQLMPLAGQLLDAQMKGDAQFDAAAATLSPESKMAVKILLTGEDGFIAQINALQKNLNGRSGWWTSEQRPGNVIIRARDAFGGPEQTIGAQNLRHARQLAAQLQRDGLEIVDIKDKADLPGHNIDAPESILQKYVEIEEAGWQRSVVKMKEAKLITEDQAKALLASYSPGTALGASMVGQGVKQFLQKRELRPGRERLDSLEVFTDYSTRLSGAIAKRSVRNHMALLLGDQSLEPYVTARDMIDKQLKAVTTGSVQEVSELRAMVSAYYLGLNVSSAMVEGTQSLVTLIPMLVRNAAIDPTTGKAHWSIPRAYQSLAGSIHRLVQLSQTANQPIVQKLVDSARQRLANNETMTRDEAYAFYYRQALDQNILDHGYIEDINYGRDQKLLMRKKFGVGQAGDLTKATMVKNSLYWGSQYAMWVYSHMSNYNTKISFLAGLDQGMDRGLKGQELFDYATNFKNLTMFGGGKAAQPGYIAQLGGDSKIMKSTLGLVSTLQVYGLGMTTMMGQMISESINRSGQLSFAEKAQARRAAGVMLATQTALSGAVGIPLVGATMRIIEKLFHVNAEEAVREGLSNLGGDNEELGNLISDVAMSGYLSRATGFDLSSRLGVNTLLGTSSYQGFDIQDVLGPVPSIIENLLNATSELAKGNPLKAARHAAPQALKNILEIADTTNRHGEFGFYDNSNRLVYRPSPIETMGYAAGFRPLGVAQKRRGQQLIRVSDTNYNESRDRELDALALRLRKGDPTVVIDLKKRQLEDPTFDAKAAFMSVLDRVTDMTHEIDLQATGMSGNEESRRNITNLIGGAAKHRQSEMDRLVTKKIASEMGGGQLLGVDPTANGEIEKAGMIDQLTALGLSRQEAVRMLEQLGN